MSSEISSPIRSQMAPTIAELERTLDKLADARPFAKAIHQPRAFALAAKLLRSDEGVAALYALAPRFDEVGLFHGGDWASPHTLSPGLVRTTLAGEGMYPALECLNQLRFLAIASGEATHPDLTPEDARAYLEEVLARNLDLPFPVATEASRRPDAMAERLQRLFRFLLERLGTDGIIRALAHECERVLLQRPIMVQRVEDMLRSAAELMSRETMPRQGPGYDQARWMIEALTGPSERSRAHPDPAAYGASLEALDQEALLAELRLFGQRMNESGLVSPAHASLLRVAVDREPALLADGLALGLVGRTSLAEHGSLVSAIVRRAVLPETARCIYGLSRLLNRGILFFPPVRPALQGLLVTPIDPHVGRLLQDASGLADPPDPTALLLAGTLSVVGQPRGVDQGHNPTCQAARAISLWSQNDVGYLLELITRAATENDVLMHFEGGDVRSSDLDSGLAEELHTELDPVSLVLTPHLDKIYMEMGRRTIGRSGDGHRWINPEFHGWWVYKGFASLVDPVTHGVRGFENFVRVFYASYPSVDV